MAKRSTVYLTTGPAGSGKTYRRCAKFMVDEFLPKETGHIYTNYPVFAEKMAEAVSKKHKIPKEDILKRIHVIPKEELDKWMLTYDKRYSDRAEGPWSYFQDIDINNAHIAIDEIHNFCGVSTPKHQRQKWGKWLGEIRHRGATVEFLTQSPNKLADEIKWEASVLISLVNGETNRDPFFKIMLSHWYELQAALTGVYEKKIHQIEKRSIDGKWRVSHRETFTLDPYYFQFYDSFAAPHTGGKAGKAAQHEFQRYGRVGVFWWFIKSHPFALASRALILGLFCWVVLLGGNQVLFKVFLEKLSYLAKKQTAAKKVEKLETAKAVSLVSSSPVVNVASVVPPGSELSQVRQELEKANKEKQSLQEKLASESAIALMTRDSVLLKNGLTLSKGEEIDSGLYQGKTVEGIVWQKRSIILSDGLVLRMEN